MASTAVEKREERHPMSIREARGFLTSEAMMEQFRSVVSAAMKPERLVRVALTAMSRNPDLLLCTQESLALALMEAGSLGLEPTGVMGEAYLVPRWNKNVKAKEANFQVGYRGLVKLARRSGEVHDVLAEIVYENDHFLYQLGLDQKLEHLPCKPSERGAVRYVYAIARMRQGPPIFEVLTFEEVEKARRVSTAADSGPWVTWWEEMAKKTAVRKVCKRLPMEADAEAVIAYDTAVDVQAHGSGRVQLARFAASRPEDVPEPEEKPKADPQGTSKGLAEKLQASKRGGPPEDPDAPPTKGDIEQLKSLLEKAAKAGALDFKDSEEYELAIHDENGRVVRDGIRDLSLALIAKTGGGQPDLGMEG